MREQPEQQAPPVQRLRIRYAKRGRLRFTSHRDFSRAFERAVFRARVPMAYSSGFNPHPRISYAGAAPTGSASEAEYLEIALAEVVDPAAIHLLLEESLPDGLDILEVVNAGTGSLADHLQASRWLIDLDLDLGVATEAVTKFLAAEEVSVERMTKKGLRTFDCRSAVSTMSVEPGDRGSRIDVLLRHGVPSVRPDDVLTGLRQVAELETTAGGVLLTRVAQGPLLEDGTIGDPLV
ncbi:MAG TPA: TIGR03936 family radical SAM-associated protein [Nocardioides sp.]